jgi:dTDP-4-amino-4,6-dideoxygalactose transaminase
MFLQKRGSKEVKMKVNFFDVKRQYDSLKKEFEESTINILRSGSYIMGPNVTEFEENIAKYLGVKYAISTANGTESLVIALESINIKPGDEVITTPFSFFATAEAIAVVGAIPVFVDVDINNYNLDPSKIEEKITNKTKAILPVHIFGNPANMDEINLIAKKHNLYVIEDACQAIGSEYKNKKIGGIGDIGCFSFYPTKNLGCFGDGGLITTNSEKLATICLALKTHGAGKNGLKARNILFNEKEEIEEQVGGSELYDPYKYFNYLIGHNSRLDSIQAGILNIKLKHLDEYNLRRKINAEKYIKELSTISEITCPKETKNGKSCWHQFAILVKDKNELISYLTEKGVGTANFYPIPLHLQKAFDYLGYSKGTLKNAEKICSETVCLPIFPELKDEEIEYIIKNIKEYYGRVK